MKVFFLSRKMMYIIAAVVIVVILLLLFFNFNGDLASVFSANNKLLPIYSVETDEKVVAISFDAAWGDIILLRKINNKKIGTQINESFNYIINLNIPKMSLYLTFSAFLLPSMKVHLLHHQL